MSQRQPITGVTVILSILLALILRSALETYFRSLIGTQTLLELCKNWPPTWESWVRTSQFVVFLVLLTRFYFGAYRINEEQMQPLKAMDAGINLLGSFGLFMFFYVVTINLWKLDLFYVSIFLMHVFDLVWFVVLLVRLPRQSPLHKTIGWFIAFDVLTLLLFVFLSLFLWGYFIEGTRPLLQTVLLIVLLGVSAWDCFMLRAFYFNPERWRGASPQPHAPA